MNKTPKSLANFECFERLNCKKIIKYSNIKTSDEINVMKLKLSQLRKYIIDRKPDSIT